jgi:protein involved in polysaccharide export with SLBB domain
MIGLPRINICVLLAAMSLVAGCAKPASEQPRKSVGQTVPRNPQAEPQAGRLSIGDTVVVSLDGTPVPVAPFTNQVASDGTVTIWNSLHIRAAGITTDELASQIRQTLVTNWVHVDEVNVLKAH